MMRNPRAIDASSEMLQFNFSERDVADVAAYVVALAS